jgi:3,4-dihydroxy 2-butanone 4-phosphate synthase / GTP cyclohydrolase II
VASWSTYAATKGAASASLTKFGRTRCKKKGANLELGLPVDSREYGVGAQILADLGVQQLRLMTNNPRKYGGLAGYNLSIVERIPMLTTPTAENANYLQTKKDRLGHFMEPVPDERKGTS